MFCFLHFFVIISIAKSIGLRDQATLVVPPVPALLLYFTHTHTHVPVRGLM